MIRILFIISLSLLLVNCQNETETSPTTEAVATTVSEKAESPTPDSLLRHVVLFKFKDEASESNIQSIEEAFSALPGAIPEIVDYEWGTNNSPEGLNNDFTHCFFVSFASEEGRAIYLPHPAHQAFVKVLEPHLDKVLVLDYWNK